MAHDAGDMLEEYLVACLKERELLNITGINESEHLSFGEGPVYTHFGSIGEFQFRALVEAAVWTTTDWENVMEANDMHVGDLKRLRA